RRKTARSCRLSRAEYLYVREQRMWPFQVPVSTLTWLWSLLVAYPYFPSSNETVHHYRDAFNRQYCTRHENRGCTTRFYKFDVFLIASLESADYTVPSQIRNTDEHEGGACEFDEASSIADYRGYCVSSIAHTGLGLNRQHGSPDRE